MKLNLIRETLLKPLQLVIGVVDRKQTLPILSNVLLSIETDQLSITGTDLEVELIGQTKLDKHSTQSSRLTIPGRKLIDICRALPDNAPIELYRDKEKIILRSGRSRFMLSTLPSEDFPAIERRKSQLELSLPQGTFRHLLHRTHFAMAQQDVRYYLNGLLLETYPNKLRAIATDGHRLAANTLLAQTNTEHRLQIIIPRKGIIELLRLLREDEVLATIRIGNNHIGVSTNDFAFTSKLIEGRFPDCERVIPKDGDKQFVIDRDILKQALSRTAILCNGKFKGVRFELRQGLLRILATNPEQEAAEEEININYTGENLDIGFNVGYLLDILNVVNSGNIRLTFSTADSSVLINEVENPSDSAFVVMPMRL
ncbi:DNA polymerase III subunit beta [Coxiella endosymbiont of Ornithodoros amblus]|uniref:DNA polymerase III subunit beta n=1 Tax=Coxiella endosymbiont of Ornithodoros amblus TaxID=1656166 RepID=UPI00244E1F5F|nr:DNA polymerase III subunit beta [Coxiella endosymbiont of Ornithodoros amblus]MBW5802754.1 DNA polymerase III subunit beta [Coxiella endosymbiont of Ornithodoros amblus]